MTEVHLLFVIIDRHPGRNERLKKKSENFMVISKFLTFFV